MLKEGDIVSIDVGAFYNGYHGDCARTFPCGKISPEAERLIRVTKESFYAGLSKTCPGGRVGDISAAVQTAAESAGFSVVREYIGHGVGQNLHEAPDVPNFGIAGKGPRLYAGMTLAIEPMVNVGTHEVRVLKDGWTTVTADLSAYAGREIAAICLVFEGEAQNYQMNIGNITVTDGKFTFRCFADVPKVALNIQWEVNR